MTDKRKRRPLGWVCQFFNAPDRKALDDKLSANGKVETHAIAPKTRVFIERHRVE